MRILKQVSILALAAFGFATQAIAQGDWTMFVGTYTKGVSKGIYAYKFQSSTGKLTPIGLVGATSNPSFLAVHPSQRFLYAVNENNPAGMVSAFAIDPATANLKLLNQVSSKGSDPCHLSVDKTGRWLFVANYSSGSVSAYRINANGSLSEAVTTIQHTGKSVDPQRQTSAHAHMAAISPDNRFVWVNDLGLDEVLSYRIDPTRGLVANDPPFVKVDPGFGPRHTVFRADSKFAYVLSEMGAAVTVFSYDAAKGAMQKVQTISMLPQGYSGGKSGAEIMLHPNGNFLYASNRGHDSIAIFKVDAAAGTLTAVGNVSTGGKTPRNFAIDPSGNYLLAANQDTNNVVVFKIDRQTGSLTPTGDNVEVGAPVSLLFVSPTAAAAGPGRGEEVPLWANGAPGSEGITAPEVSTPSGNAKYAGWPANFTVTHYPSLYVFLPKGKATGAAAVVAPGGGHTQLVIEKEGWEMADWLNARGIAAFVLKYRLAKAPGSTYTLPKEVYADAARSLRLVRSRAKEWGVDPARVGFLGFSAGGEVAGMVETKFDAGKPDSLDPVERFSSRPDFNVLVYPFYRPGAQDASAAPLFPVPDNAPPAFLVCADDDRSHVEPTVKFYLELEGKHVPTEMHIYAYGTHGFALRPTAKPAPVMSWADRLQDWLGERGISK